MALIKVSFYVLAACNDEDNKRVQNNAVYVEKSPGAQLGLFARKEFSIGQLVLQESPFLVVPACSNDIEDTKKRIEDLLDGSDQSVLLKFWDLSDKYALDNANDGHKTVVGIVETNGLPMGESTSSWVPESAGLYVLMCRMNHSCKPNVHHHYNMNTKKHEIHGIRAIGVGEEITTSYFHVAGKSFLERQKLQKMKWNFQCTCERCHLESIDTEKRIFNDNRESKIEKLDAEIQYMSSLDPIKAVSKSILRIFELNFTECFYDPIETLRNLYDAFQIT